MSIPTKGELSNAILERLKELLEDEGFEDEEVETITPLSPLLSEGALISSLSLVSLVSDMEMMILEEHDIEILLISEEAFSRGKSPFRDVEALAEYILEL